MQEDFLGDGELQEHEVHHKKENAGWEKLFIDLSGPVVQLSHFTQ